MKCSGKRGINWIKARLQKSRKTDIIENRGLRTTKNLKQFSDKSKLRLTWGGNNFFFALQTKIPPSPPPDFRF